MQQRGGAIALIHFYITTSRPFNPPETGKIAIKVINHTEMKSWIFSVAPSGRSTVALRMYRLRSVKAGELRK